MRGIYFTAVGCAVLEFFFLFQPSSLLGEELSFAPRINSSEGYLEVGMESQTNENTQNGAGTRSTGTSLRENINLAADGYVYHPRFLLFLSRVSGGLNQWSDTGSPGRTLGSSRATENHELRALLLPEHPYSLELFTRHQQSAAMGTFLRAQAGTVDERGAIFSYKDRPLFFHSSFVATSVESRVHRTDTDTFRMNGSYAGTVMTNTAAYSHADSSSSFALRTTREEYAFGNTTRLAGMSLDSRITDNSNDQRKPLGPDFHTDSLSWTEQLTAPLPWNFDSNASFGYFDAKNRTGEYQSDPEKNEFNRSVATAFSLSHRLYRSLVTNYTVNNSALKSTAGELKTRSDSLSSIYTKETYSGRVTAGVHVINADSERTGTPSIINEVHSAALLGTFSLTQRDVVEGSIVVQVKDPSTGGLITLTQGNYLVNRLGDGFEIAIVSISPVVPQADPTYAYEFHVAYSLLNKSEIVRNSWGYSFKLDILENLLSLYYNYSTSNVEVVSGSLTGGSGRDTTDIAGAAAQYGHYAALLEHQRFRSWQNPSETWKATGHYRAPLARNAYLSSLLSYQHVDYFPSPALGTTGTRQERFGGNVMLDKKFPRRNLNFFISTSYDRTRSFVDVDTFSVNTYLTWHVGLLSVNGGAQLNRSESTIASGRVVLSSQYYYLTLIRKLF